MLSNLAPVSEIEEASPAAHPHELLLAEFIHRSANDLAVTCAAINLARRAATLDEACDRLEIAVERLLALAAIQRILLIPKGGRMELGSTLCELCGHHAAARFTEQAALVRVSTADVEIDARRGWTMLVIVSELLTNTARHAFRSPGGLVNIDLTSAKDQIRCVVSDNGAGIAASHATGAGTSLITALALDAGIQWSRTSCPGGTIVEMRMPTVAAVLPSESLTGFYHS